MNSRQTCKFTMGLALRDFLNQNAKITSTLPGFGTLSTAFSDNLNKILVIKEEQGADKTGIALQKEELKTDLIDKALDISRRTGSYAKMTHNVVLENEVRFSGSKLKRANNNLLIDQASLIHDRAEANLTSLEAFGVTADTLASLKSAIELFITAIPKPRLGITEKKNATDRLTALFRANDELLEQMDALVEIVRVSELSFFSTYFDNRKVIDTGKGSIALKVTVTDASTQSGIKGVKVSFTHQEGQLKMNTPKADKPMVKTTAAKGIFMIKSIASGTWTATVVKPGFKGKVVTVTVAENERTYLNVELERN